MLVFIDESGDAGLKIESGSSTHFVVTLIVFYDNDEAIKTDTHFAEIRKQLNLHKDFEFHFHRLSQRIREHFLNEIIQFDFQYFSIVIDKIELLKVETLQDSIHQYACELVCLLTRDHLKEASIVIDGQGSREFKRKLASYLRQSVNDKNEEVLCIKKVKMQDSEKNNLLQLADMVCGSVARFYKDKSDAKLYRKIIEKCEAKVQLWSEIEKF